MFSDFITDFFWSKKYLVGFKNRVLVGFIQYDSGREFLEISFIEAARGFKRKGIATSLMVALFGLFSPEKQMTIYNLGLTREGRKFFKSFFRDFSVRENFPHWDFKYF